MKLCPKCNGSQFLVRAILDQMWKVDGEGKLIEVTESETIRDEDDNSTWVCCKCGHVARGIDLEEKMYEVTVSINKRRKIKARNAEEAIDVAIKNIVQKLDSDDIPMAYYVRDENENIILEDTF